MSLHTGGVPRQKFVIATIIEKEVTEINSIFFLYLIKWSEEEKEVGSLFKQGNSFSKVIKLTLINRSPASSAVFL